MNRLMTGLYKLEGAKRGLTDAYVQDEDGVWVATKKAKGTVDLEDAVKESLFVEKKATELGKALKTFEILDTEGFMTKVKEEFAKKAFGKKEEGLIGSEKIFDTGEPLEHKVHIVLNQPSKLTVLFENTQYRVKPFIGGETFVAVATAITMRGKHVVYACPIGDMYDSEHGKIKRIEVEMSLLNTNFDVKKEMREELMEKAREKINKKKEAREVEQVAVKERMEKNELFGSW